MKICNKLLKSIFICRLSYCFYFRIFIINIRISFHFAFHMLPYASSIVLKIAFIFNMLCCCALVCNVLIILSPRKFLCNTLDFYNKFHVFHSRHCSTIPRLLISIFQPKIHPIIHATMFQFEVDKPVVPESSLSAQNCGFNLSDRIISDNCAGTVKYIGSVGSHPGIWLGVEWDDISRGKHNGTAEGVQYFQASSENAGSFVRPLKVRKIKSALQALHIRYGEDEEIINQLKTAENVPMERIKIKYRCHCRLLIKIYSL